MQRFVVLGFSVSLFLSACSTFTKAKEQNLALVHIGQTKAQLVEVLGEPDSRKGTDDGERWYYDIYSSDNRRIYPYTAVFDNGVLKQWNFDTARNMEDIRHQPPGRTPSGTHIY